VPHADEGILREVLDLSRSADTAVGGTEQLFAALYDELHRLAERQLRAAGGDSTLSATTLLHEAYLDMAGRAAYTSRIAPVSWDTPRAPCAELSSTGRAKGAPRSVVAGSS
jgi:hypothetical protein